MTKRLTWEQKSIVSHDTGHALVKAVPEVRPAKVLDLATSPVTN